MANKTKAIAGTHLSAAAFYHLLKRRLIQWSGVRGGTYQGQQSLRFANGHSGPFHSHHRLPVGYQRDVAQLDHDCANRAVPARALGKPSLTREQCGRSIVSNSAVLRNPKGNRGDRQALPSWQAQYPKSS